MSTASSASKQPCNRWRSGWMLRALYLLSLAVVLAIIVHMFRGLEEPMPQFMLASQPGYSHYRSTNSLLTAAANQQHHVLHSNPAAEANHLKQAAAPGRMHSLPSSTDAAPRSQPVTVQGHLHTPEYKPLPWRALQHLHKDLSTVGSSTSTAVAHAPAYLVSAYLDTRRMLKGKQPRVAVILEVDKEANRQDWGCLLSLGNPAVSSHGSQQYYSKLMVPYIVPNNEHFFQYQAATGFCEVPEDLLHSLIITQAAPNSTSGQQPHTKKLQQQQQLHVTVVKAKTAVHAYMRRYMLDIPWQTKGVNKTAGRTRIGLESWVQVEVMSPLGSVTDYASSVEGSIAVCTPPLHTDAYAVTLIEWAEFARLMGASRILAYAFNPGPLIKPLIDYYLSTGYFKVHEWIIPRSILRNQAQRCKLPFLQHSANRDLYDSPNCTYHQDNYNTAWWGQVAAVQDCVYRAMSQRHRWVVITDFDEYIVPQGSSTRDWPAMLQELSKLNTGGKPAVEYQFKGVRVCSGCTTPLESYLHHNSTAKSSQQNSSARPRSYLLRHLRAAQNPAASLKRAPAAGAADACVHPSVGFDHILWSAVVSTTSDHVKCIVDPLAVGQASVHGTAHFSPDSVAAGIVAAPTDVALKLHDRVHDIHATTTFATTMSPLLLKHVQNDVGLGVERSVRPSVGSSKVQMQGAPWPKPTEELCDSCGSRAGAGSHVVVDYGMCNLYGHALSGAELCKTCSWQGPFLVGETCP